MKYFEFGKENKEIMVMLHGGGVSYEGAVPVAEYMKQFYHVIVVSYDGFNPTEPDTTFSTVDHEAEMLAKYINENYDGKIDILYGVSYGCRVLMAVLARKDLKVVTTIADGMGTGEYPNIKSEWGKNLWCFFFTGFFYQMMGKAGPIRKKIVVKLTGRTMEEANRLLYQKASWESWRNQDKCLIGKKTDYSLFNKTNMNIWHCTNSYAEKRLAKNMNEIKAKGYSFTYKVFTDVGHGGLPGEQVERFADEVKAAHSKAIANKNK